MRSVRQARDHEPDLTARARIRDAAIRCFGREGFAVPLRAIAAEGGVSAGLVIHHFGSKEKLRAACDEHVLRAVREAKKQTIVEGGPTDMLAQLARLEEYAPLAGYVVEALLAGGDLAEAFLGHLVEDAETYLQQAVAAGRIRASRDPARRARFLVHAGVGSLLVYLRGRAQAGADLRDVLDSYLAAVALPALELYTEGLFTDSGLLEAYLAHENAPRSRASTGSEQR